MVMSILATTHCPFVHILLRITEQISVKFDIKGKTVNAAKKM